MIRLNKRKKMKQILITLFIIELLLISIIPQRAFAITDKQAVIDWMANNESYDYAFRANSKNLERVIDVTLRYVKDILVENNNLVFVYGENGNVEAIQKNLTEDLAEVASNFSQYALFVTDATYKKEEAKTPDSNPDNNNNNTPPTEEEFKQQIRDKLDKYALTNDAKDIVLGWYEDELPGVTKENAVTVKKDSNGNVTDVILDIDTERASAIGMSDGVYDDAIEDKKEDEEEDDSDLEGADKGAVGGVLLGPIAWLLQGIGDATNQMIQLVFTGSWERVFYDTGFGNFNKKRVTDAIARNPANGDLEYVDVVQDFIKTWTKSYGIPEIKITPADIFAGNVAALDANFFANDADISNKIGGDKNSIVSELRPIVAKWYVAIRNIAIVGLLSVLLYIGIRIVISSSAGDKAKYKQLFTDWVVALCLIFFMHYIMSFTMTMSETITDVLAGPETPQQGTIKQVNIRLTKKDGSPISGMEFSSNFTGVARIKADYKDESLKMGYSILYLILTGYTVYFSFVYLKRLVMLAFFTMIAPLVALTYPIDKVKDGKAQAFNYWFKEYMFYALLQPIHMVLYTVLIGSALEIATTNLLYAIVAFACIVPAEKILKQMFGVKGSTESAISGFAGGALASQAFSAIKSLGKGKTGGGIPNPAGKGAGNGIRMPNRPNAMDTLASGAMNPDSSTANAASAAMAGAAAGAGMASGNSAADAYQNTSDPVAASERENLEEQIANGTINPNELTDAQKALLGMNEPNEVANASSNSTPNETGASEASQPEPQNTFGTNPAKEKYEAHKKQLKSMPGNFGKAVQRRWVAAGGMNGVAKKAAKGYVKGAMAITGAAIGASMGAIGGDVNNLWQAGAAGLVAGGVVGNKVNKDISNFGNSAVGRFAGEVLHGDDYQKQQYIKQYMNNSENTKMIMEKNPKLNAKEINARKQEMAEMSYRTGITDFSTLNKAVDIKQKTVAEEERKIQNQNISGDEKAKRMKEIQQKAFEQTAAYAQLSQNISEDTLSDDKKRENAIKYRQKQLENRGVSSNAARAEAEKIIRMAEQFKS